MKTPKTRKNQGDGVEQEKSSGKKLVQARLPFKKLSTPESAEKTPSDVRKRKLSYDKEETGSSEIEQSSKRRSVRRTIDGVSAKKQNESHNKESTRKVIAGSVVVLSDSNEEENDVEQNDSGCKENVKSIVAKQRAPINREETDDVHSDDVELIESTDEEKSKLTDEPKRKSLPPKSTSNMKSVKKTPQSAKKPTTKGRKSAGDITPNCKLQIKLPVSSKKNKRRKQASKSDVNTAEHDTNDEMSDEVEVISKELHPEKRAKFSSPDKSKKITDEVSEIVLLDKDDTEQIQKDKDVPMADDVRKNDVIEPVEEKTKSEVQIESGNTKNCLTNEISLSKSEENRRISEELVSGSEQSKSKSHDISSTASDLEADTETETTINSENQVGKRIETQSRSKKLSKAEITSSPNVGDSSTNKIQKKNLTPKQQKLIEQRQRAREEKERKIQEERLLKQREKEERELAKKRDREEKEEQRRKEREEKEEQRRKEREEKERKRLAETEAKNEEKRKRNEAKEEELRKKEEERKRKEQEKEEAEIKKKKAAMAFTKFFSRTTQDSAGQRTKENDVSDESHEFLAFRPFQIKGDMKLAPIVRKKLTDEERERLVSLVESKNCNDKEIKSRTLYLNELKSGTIKPFKWTQPIQDETETVKSKQDVDNDDVVIIEDELERAGQAIVEEHNLPIDRFRAKFYKFSENRRPPYYGTWRKKSTVITPRRPFSQDKKFFDYEVDSDDEWEEEEPGESLDGSDDDKEKESEDEDYEVDNEWFVPHGHLSEEEMQNEDDLGENNDREAQKAKLQILQQEFAQEMKKKTEKIKPRLIGCIWVDENGNQPEFCPKIIWDTLNTRSILCHEPPITEEIETTSEKNGDTNTTNGQNGERTNGETKLKPITLTETMLKELIKLLHGNTHSKNFLIKEFIAYIEANEESVRNGDVRVPLKSAVREKIEEYAQWQVIESTRNHSEDGSKSAKKQKSKKKLCWVVSKDTLRKMDLESLVLNNNNWEYILQPRKHIKNTHTQEEPTSVAIVNGEDSNEQCDQSVENKSNNNDTTTTVHIKNKPKPDIKKFAKVLTAEEKVQQLQKKVEKDKSSSAKNTLSASPTKNQSIPITNQTPKPSSANKTPTVKKRVPLLISVARGQSISTPDKNARISQFLKTINNAKQKEKEGSKTSSTPMETDDIILLD